MARVELGDGGSLYFEELGEGEPLLVLNGIMMSTASWAELAPVLARRLRVVLVDFRDQGRSSRREPGYDLEAHVDDVLALLDHLGFDRVHLLGLSYGGQVALRLALRRSDRLASLLLANVVRRISRHLRSLGEAWEVAAELDDPRRFFALALPTIYSAGFYERAWPWLEERRALFERALTTEWFEALVRLSRATRDYEVTDAELASIAVPTLLLASDRDLVAPVEHVDELHRLIPEAEMLVLRDAGHAAFLERPGEMATAVLGFVLKRSTPVEGRPTGRE